MYMYIYHARTTQGQEGKISRNATPTTSTVATSYLQDDKGPRHACEALSYELKGPHSRREYPGLYLKLIPGFRGRPLEYGLRSLYDQKDDKMPRKFSFKHCFDETRSIGQYFLQDIVSSPNTIK